MTQKTQVYTLQNKKQKQVRSTTKLSLTGTSEQTIALPHIDI